MPQGAETEILIRIVAAAVLGMVLGIERSLAGKHAGLRTYALVSMGSALFVTVGMLASYQFIGSFPGLNPFMIASNVVLGVGFLGAGLTVFRTEHPVELTTAAGLWLSAGVGMACGFGYLMLAGVSAVLAVLIFSLFLKAENALRRRWGDSSVQ